MPCLSFFKFKKKRPCCLNIDDAIFNGHIGCIQKFRQAGEPWGNYTIVRAVQWDRLECVEYAHRHGCPWSMCAVETAMCCGNLPILKYVCQNGCPLSRYVSYGSPCMQCVLFLYNYRGHGIKFNYNAQVVLKEYTRRWSRSIEIIRKEYFLVVPRDIFTVIETFLTVVSVRPIGRWDGISNRH